VIRRLFWLTLGAVMGVAGYRRATALVRSLSPGHRARELTRFASDVREGMELYMERHPGQAPPTLGGQPVRPTLADNGATDHGATDHGATDHGATDHGATDHWEDGR
jgi:hypothetical protein